MRSALTSKRHHYNSYYYNFHHFRWKKCQLPKSAAGMESNKASKRYDACYKSTHTSQNNCFHRQKAAPLMTFASFILMISTLLVLTSNRSVHCQGKLTAVTEALDFKDSPRQPSRSVEVKNCFSLERKKSWPRAIMYNNSTASVNIDLTKIDQSVLECLKGKQVHVQAKLLEYFQFYCFL